MSITVNNSYKQLRFYKSFDIQYQVKYDNLVLQYGKLLNSGNKKTLTVYTLHDFDHHCYNILEILGNFIHDTDKLTPIEKYLLAIAVLLHDISMSTKFDFTRENHSSESCDYIKDEYKKNGVIKSLGELSKNDLKVVCSIVKAHSGKNMLSNINEYDDSSCGKVRTKLLAALLRLSDELDVTSNRIGNDHDHIQLESGNDEDKESYKHWNKLSYFSGFKLVKGININLIVDDEHVSSLINQGDFENIKTNICEVYEKITHEFNEFNQIIDDYSDGYSLERPRSFILIRSFKIFTDNEDIRSMLNYKIKDSLKIDANTAVNITKSLNGKSNQVTVLNQDNQEKDKYPILIGDISESINVWVKDKNLFITGHFIVNKFICSRDWINTRELLETSRFSDLIVENLYNHIQLNRNLDINPVLIGIDVEGALIASKLALLLDLKFTYVLPKIKSDVSDLHDKLTEISSYSKVIFISDVISTLGTIREIIKEYNIEIENVESIYSLLYREPKNIQQSSKKYEDILISRTYVLNSFFKIEVVESAVCERRNECIAINKPKR